MPWIAPSGKEYKSTSMKYYVPVETDMRKIDNKLKRELSLSDHEYQTLKTFGLKYCRKCQMWKMFDDYHNDISQNKDRKNVICKSCKSLYMIKHYRAYRPLEQYRAYKGNAAQRGLSFELTQEDFLTLKNHACTYCGRKDSHLGYDRINNKEGYSLNNITPCCSICNYMKCDLSVELWLKHIKDVLRNLNHKEIS